MSLELGVKIRIRFRTKIRNITRGIKVDADVSGLLAEVRRHVSGDLSYVMSAPDPDLFEIRRLASRTGCSIKPYPLSLRSGTVFAHRCPGW
jgi:hypothetical protein